MKLKTLKLRNFRAYRGDVEVPIGDLTALIGRNDVGKSSLLEALGIFLGEPSIKLDATDLCVYVDATEVRIGCVFTDLPEALILDTTSRTSLRQEHLLNEGGDLELQIVYACQNGKATLRGQFAVALHPTADAAADLLSLKNADLKDRARKSGVDMAAVDLRSNTELRAAIRAATPDLALSCVDVPLNKEDGKVVWSQLAQHLPSFALFRADRASTDQDDEVQDPLSLAVKQALVDVAPELRDVKQKVEEHALDVAKRTLRKLQEIDPSLAHDLTPRFDSEPQWHKAFKLSLTSDDSIPLNKRGSGVRRLVLLSFFRAEAERRREEDQKQNIIYAIEEPEASQHPNNQRMLIEALKELSADEGCQVLVTTHVPGLAELLPVESLRHIERDADGHTTVGAGTDVTYERVANGLGVLPDGRVRVLVCLEGPHDVRCLRHLGRALRAVDTTIPDLEGDARIAVLPLGGATLKDWVFNHYLRGLRIPEIHIYDRGTDTPPKYADARDHVNARGDGSRAFITTKRELENYLHADVIRSELGVEVCVEDDCDVPLETAKAVHEAAPDSGPWDSADHSKKERRVKGQLNDACAAAMTISLLEARSARTEIESWLSAIREAVARNSL